MAMILCFYAKRNNKGGRSCKSVRVLCFGKERRREPKRAPLEIGVSLVLPGREEAQRRRGGEGELGVVSERVL